MVSWTLQQLSDLQCSTVPTEIKMEECQKAADALSQNFTQKDDKSLQLSKLFLDGILYILCVASLNTTLDTQAEDDRSNTTATAVIERATAGSVARVQPVGTGARTSKTETQTRKPEG